MPQKCHISDTGAHECPATNFQSFDDEYVHRLLSLLAIIPKAVFHQAATLPLRVVVVFCPAAGGGVAQQPVGPCFQVFVLAWRRGYLLWPVPVQSRQFFQAPFFIYKSSYSVERPLRFPTVR